MASSSCRWLPLAAAGYRVLAIERDGQALRGGVASLPDGMTAHVPGLVERLKLEALDDRVEIVEADFLTADLPEGSCRAVWTSCSWHYSANHHRPLADFVGRMQALVAQDGLFGAEFMMPVDPRHEAVEHYASPERLERHFSDAWRIDLTLRTNEFTERAHIGQPYDHNHRMGLLLATRTGH